MDKKYIAIGAIMLLSISFFSGRISTSGRTQDMGRTIDSITEQLEREVSERERITAELRTANGEINELTTSLKETSKEVGQLGIELGEATEENKRLTAIVGEIGKGLETDSEGLSEVIEGIRSYIPAD